MAGTRVVDHLPHLAARSCPVPRWDPSRWPAGCEGVDCAPGSARPTPTSWCSTTGMATVSWPPRPRPPLVAIRRNPIEPRWTGAEPRRPHRPRRPGGDGPGGSCARRGAGPPPDPAARPLRGGRGGHGRGGGRHRRAWPRRSGFPADGGGLGRRRLARRARPVRPTPLVPRGPPRRGGTAVVGSVCRRIRPGAGPARRRGRAVRRVGSPRSARGRHARRPVGRRGGVPAAPRAAPEVDHLYEIAAGGLEVVLRAARRRPAVGAPGALPRSRSGGRRRGRSVGRGAAGLERAGGARPVDGPPRRRSRTGVGDGS